MAGSTTIILQDVESFKTKALLWADHFKVVCLLDSNHYQQKLYKSKEWQLAVDAVSELQIDEQPFKDLKRFRKKSNGDIFGFLSYDLKNRIEKLTSNNHDGLHFPNMYFFSPRYLFKIAGDKLTINRNYLETYEIVHAILNYKSPTRNHKSQNLISLLSRTSKEKYLLNVEAIKRQIEDGDFYELNYCNEFFSDNAKIVPAEIFLKLNAKAKAPFSSYFKLYDKYLLCASPERYLKKEGNKLVAQPVKGTIRKGKTSKENERLKLELFSDAKEKAENVMIVDLVRNDLAKSSKQGSVKVDELFGVYEFPTVNQMISTVTSEITSDAIDTIKNAFPMGSMTGAPKVEVMKNIERYEDFKRGLYSGSVGYFSAEGDFDFNVVIRSILYNSSEKYLSVRAGSAITSGSTAQKEWEEILLKAKQLIEVLNAKIL